MTLTNICIPFVLSTSSSRHLNSIKRHIREIADSINRSSAKETEGETTKDLDGNEFLASCYRLIDWSTCRRRTIIIHERKKEREKDLDVDEFYMMCIRIKYILYIYQN